MASDGRFTEKVMFAAMLQIARDHGLNAAGAMLLRLTNNAVFALPESGVVVRIARSTRLGDRVSKGVALARWFAEIDAPTIRLAGPSDQPITANGLHATVWRYIAPMGEPPTVAELGAVIKQFHALGLPEFDLPGWDPVGDARRRLDDAEALPDDERRLLIALCDDLEPQVDAFARSQPATLIHGDAYVGNLLRAGRRVLLCDFDGTCAGPWQADLVAVPVADDRFGRSEVHADLVHSYGYDVRLDPAWPILRAARELKMIVAAVPLLASTPGYDDEFRLRLNSIVDNDEQARWTPFAEIR